MSIRILVADDHNLIRAGLMALLKGEPDLDVVGEAADGPAVLQLAAELQPDVILLDISMPGMSGIEVTRHLNASSPGMRILALTVHEDESMVREVLRAGGYGYILKRAVTSDLLGAIRAVARGEIYVHPAMTGALLRDLSPHSSASQVSKDDLTPREIGVLRLLARGYTNRQIAAEMNISPRTVEGHRSSLVAKLGISSRVELMNYVEEQGLAEPKKPAAR